MRAAKTKKKLLLVRGRNISAQARPQVRRRQTRAARRRVG
jgi:hypothetical protein